MGLFSWEHIGDDPGIDQGFRQDADEETATGRSNRWLAFLVFLAIEGMLFAFFIFAIIVLRVGGTPWPPSDVPPLQRDFLALNLLVLLTSSLLVYSAERSIRRSRITTAGKRLLVAIGLGHVFLDGSCASMRSCFSMASL